MLLSGVAAMPKPVMWPPRGRVLSPSLSSRQATGAASSQDRRRPAARPARGGKGDDWRKAVRSVRSVMFVVGRERGVHRAMLDRRAGWGPLIVSRHKGRKLTRAIVGHYHAHVGCIRG
jgi:hypothetical protein